MKDLPLDILKIDAGFFRGKDDDERTKIVVSEAIHLAKRLEMKTVAEGVEEKKHVDFLADEECDMIQGYYYSKPLPKAEFEERMGMAAAVSEAPEAEVPEPVEEAPVAEATEQNAESEPAEAAAEEPEATVEAPVADETPDATSEQISEAPVAEVETTITENTDPSLPNN